MGAHGEVMALVDALAAARAQVDTLTNQLIQSMQGRMADREALAASEATARMLEAEIERLNLERVQMVEAVQKARRRRWWQF